ncbi:Golgi SNAP receptor complex member 1 [Candida viswanathii]|uniref:Golgi SNAP receptor complex member 1 n=1 Tax=Candida viswanathii TaxID=5486 RepID=A0A367YKM4_9ASCO|nr:Golgi SNAP receptor complex member 1 [Candida viswanathii]
MSSQTFTQARSQALSLEKQTEQLLSKFSQFQTLHNLDSTPDESLIIQQITDLLTRRDDVIAKMNRIATMQTSNLSTSKLQQFARHQEKLNDDKMSFNNISNRITEERNKNNLLFHVQNDINVHKQRETNSNGGINANDYILEELERVNNVSNIADRLLQGAFNTRDELLNQRQYLNNAQSKILSSLQSIPGLNVLISKINTRRKRDTLILAFVIALCILVLFFV